MRFSTVASAATLLVGAAAPAAATFDFSFLNPKCSLGNWYWKEKDLCVPVGGPMSPQNPPSGSQCPTLWFWHDKGFCCPRYTPPFTQPSCPGNWVWNTSSYSCKPPATPPPSGNNCPGDAFWWAGRSICLPHGGTPAPPTPPRGNNCPGSWWWHIGQGCCVPNHPNPPPPSCPPGTTWNPYTQCCKPDTTPPPPPTPSHKPRSAAEKRQHNAVPHHKKRAQPKQLSFCPSGFESCPVDGSLVGESECIDTSAELRSCGGCTSLGKGRDCSAIPYAQSATCQIGECKVMACKKGFTLSNNTCVALL